MDYGLVQYFSWMQWFKLKNAMSGVDYLWIIVMLFGLSF